MNGRLHKGRLRRPIDHLPGEDRLGAIAYGRERNLKRNGRHPVYLTENEQQALVAHDGGALFRQIAANMGISKQRANAVYHSARRKVMWNESVRELADC